MKSIDDDVSLTVADVSKPVLIRVYVGTSNSPHDAAFRLAWKEMKPIMENKLQTVMFAEPECLCMEQVISLEMNMEDLVNWLLNSDVHFILGNIHQGYAKHNCSIDLRDVQCQLQRLEFHNGFPSGDLLSCPVFTQDKAKYLKLLGFGEMCNPTMFIDLVDDGVFEDSVIAAVQRFCSEHTEGVGYVVKAPFVTGTSYTRFLNDFDNVVVALENASDELFGSIPCMMIQPKMCNGREYKVICYGGEPQYLATFQSDSVDARGANHSFSNIPHTELFEFVSQAVSRAKRNCPELLFQGLLRVGVFRNKDGKFVVNEFESLSVDFSCDCSDWEYYSHMFLKLFLSVQMVACAAKLDL